MTDCRGWHGHFTRSLYPGLLMAAWWVVCILSVQAQEIRYLHFTTEDGLPHNVGYDILQDSKGYLWFGLDNGLAKFDGKNFRLFADEDGLTNPFVIYLAEGLRGEIFMSVSRGGMFIKQNESISQAVSKPNSPFKIMPYWDSLTIGYGGNLNISSNITSLVSYTYKDRDIRTFRVLMRSNEPALFEIISGNNSNLNQDDAITEHFLINSRGENEGNTNNFFDEIVKFNALQRRDRSILLSFKTGLYEYLPPSTLKKVYPHIPSGKIHEAMSEDYQGNLWLGSAENLICVKPDSQYINYPIELPVDRIDHIRVTPSGKIFISKWASPLLFCYDLTSRTMMQVDPLLKTEGSVISLIETDKTGNLWVTTNGSGVYCIFDSYFKNFTQKEGLSNNFVSDFTEDDDGNIWVATASGISQIGRDESSFSVFQEAVSSGQKIYDLHFTQSKKCLFLLSNSKLAVYDLTKKQTQTIETESYILWKSFFVDSQKKIWVYGNGVETINPEIGKIELFLKIPELSVRPTIPVNIIREDKRGQIYIGTSVGLFIYHPEEETFSALTREDGLPGNFVHDIRADRTGRIWIATEAGLGFIQNDSIHALESSEGKVPDHCRKIVFDHKNRAWIATTNGLYMIDDDEIRNFNIYHGLPANDLNTIFIDSRDFLWIGTSAGVSRLDLSHIPPSADPPPVYITKVEVNGKDLPYDHRVSLSHSDALRIAYRAVDPAAQKIIDYSYRFNAQSDWRNTSNESIDLYEQSPGDYSFQIRARKTDSHWSKPTILNYTIYPPWWRSSWAIAGWILLAVLANLLFILNLRRRTHQKRETYQKFAELELSALQAQMNPHFIFNSLQAIQSFIAGNNPDAAESYLVKFSRLMRLFLESSRQKFISLEDEISLLKSYTELEKLCYEDKFDFSIEVDPRLNTPLETIPSMLIQPFVENAIKHGLLPKEGKGHLEIIFRAVDGGFCCLVRDDGPGRDSHHQQQKGKHKSRGMELIRERQEVINQMGHNQVEIEIIDLKDENGAGTGTLVNIFILAKK